MPEAPGPPTAAPTTPPPPPPETARVPRAGELTTGWRVTLAAAWAAAFFAYAAVWKTSEELGIGTWWLGPRSTPQPVIVRIIPFAIVVVIGVVSTYAMRGVPWIGLGGAAALGLVAVPDFWRSTGLAFVELAIAGALAVIAVASFAGRYRPAPPPTRAVASPPDE
ncbi:MAG: hypothetical protein AAGA42_11540 [Actinomycetota bacterium]